VKQPPLTEAPLGWLEAVVGDTGEQPDDTELDIKVRSLEDGLDHRLTYKLGDIRDELRRRTSN